MLVVRGQPPLGEHAQPALLGRGHRLDRVAVADAAARLDLAEDEGVALAGDDVELALAAAPVAVEDAQAGVGQEGGRDALAVGAEVGGGGHAYDDHPSSWPTGVAAAICGGTAALWTAARPARALSTSAAHPTALSWPDAGPG